MQACNQYHRNPDDVTLVAVGKTKPISAITELYDLGQSHFGENYLQEAMDKISAMKTSNIHWHFIGNIQSNKCRDIASRFSWVHTVDRLKIARRLAEHSDHPLNVLIQVNQSGEASKSGVEPDEALALAQSMAIIPGLRLRGLMSIPQASDNLQRQRDVFSDLRKLLEKLNNNGLELDCLSMGMTSDLEAAIAEGATHVRIGTALFGPRNYT